MKIVIVADVEPHPDFNDSEVDLFNLIRLPLINLLMDNEIEHNVLGTVAAINKVPQVYR